MPAPASTTSATARNAENIALSAGRPSRPERPSTVMAPSSEPIMLTSSHGRPARGRALLGGHEGVDVDIVLGVGPQAAHRPGTLPAGRRRGVGRPERARLVRCPPPDATVRTVHRSGRAGWLRAAVLGADDGIVSTASIIVGVAGSGAAADTVRTAGIAGLVAGALSMAAGEYVSVAAERDAERADLAKERQELQDHPQSELAELAEIWRGRGLDPEVADLVAHQLTEHDALGRPCPRRARPLAASAAPARAGGAGVGRWPSPWAPWCPLLAYVAWRMHGRSPFVMAVGTAALAGSGAAGAILGGASWRRAAPRVAVGGLVAMLVTTAIGEATGAALG